MCLHPPKSLSSNIKICHTKIITFIIVNLHESILILKSYNVFKFTMRPLRTPQSTPIDQCITCTVLIHNISPDRVTTTLE